MITTGKDRDVNKRLKKKNPVCWICIFLLAFSYNFKLTHGNDSYAAHTVSENTRVKCAKCFPVKY